MENEIVIAKNACSFSGGGNLGAMKRYSLFLLMIALPALGFGQSMCSVFAFARIGETISCGTKSVELMYVTAAGSAFATEHSAGSALAGGSCIRGYKDCNCSEQPSAEVTGGANGREQFVWEHPNGWGSGWNVWWDIRHNHGHGFHACSSGCEDGEEPDPDFTVTQYNYGFRVVYCRMD